MSPTITKAIVVRAKRPGGFWSAGRFFAAESTTEVEVTERELEQLVTDRKNGFLELSGLSFDDILEPGSVPKAEVERALGDLKALLDEALADAHEARAELATARADRDAALAKVAELEAQVAEAPSAPPVETDASTEAAAAGKPPKKPKA